MGHVLTQEKIHLKTNTLIMKNILMAAVLLCLAATSFAQTKFGIRAGLSSTDISAESFMVTNHQSLDDFTVSVKNANYGYHFGIFFQTGRKIFIQPEILFNASSTEYELTDGGFGDLASNVFKETYHDIDIPVMVGLRLGFLRLQGGPVGHFHINDSSDLTNIEGYKAAYDTFTLGYQAGLGMDIWKLVIDVKYEGNLSKYGDHMTFFGEQFDFGTRPDRMVASVGWAF